MMDLAINIASAILLAAVALALFRVVRGPTVADRVLGLDTTTLLIIGLVGVFAIRSGWPLYVDIAVALALVGFVSTAAFARYLLSRRP